MRFNERVFAREWLWFASFFLLGVALLVLAMEQGKAAARDVLAPLWIGLSLYVLVGFVRLTVWAIRVILRHRTGAHMRRSGWS